jgi:hypothetical protein
LKNWLFILAGDVQDRIGAISFEIKGAHYNLVVKLLNDRFGIQVRGGCSCAGAYGHYLFGIGRERSGEITNQIDNGVFCDKPGWIRLSLHPTMSNDTVDYIVNGIQQVAKHHVQWATDYTYNASTNEFNYNKPFKDGVDNWMEDAYDLDFDIVDGKKVYYNF